jgi:hypothetical protein
MPAGPLPVCVDPTSSRLFPELRAEWFCKQKKTNMVKTWQPILSGGRASFQEC